MRKFMLLSMLLFLALLSASWLPPATSQVLWTPIYVDGNSQVDLWTETAKGCRCGWEPARRDCACCVQDGGCPCGPTAPHRCAQCGIHHHCTNMCNMTLEARVLLSKSGKSFGQIKSPALSGPAFCWYVFLPDPGHRIELQIYRLISVGKFNGSNCEHGFVQLVDGVKPVPKAEDVQICGTNERFAPPVLLFRDKGPATLIFNVGEPTMRSQFLAYYSFTASNSSQGTGFQPYGGKKINNTECDWIYEEVWCRGSGCRLASPGYPGLYPPNRKCLYHVSAISQHTTIKANFKALYLPHNHCSTDYIKIYKGSTTSSPVLASICGNRKQNFEHDGANLLIEFSSGPLVHPFDYNGFVASLEFIEKHVTTTAATVTPFLKTTSTNILGDLSSDGATSCGLAFYGNESRSGHFDSRNQQWHQNCSIMFIGRPRDVVHLSLFNYNLRAHSCQTVIEVYDGLVLYGAKPIKRICSPIKKHARDSTGKFQMQETFMSSGNIMSILLRRPQGSQHSEPEFIDGAFLFHDEHIDGTLQPETLCDADFYGLSSIKNGQIRNPGTQQLFWNIEAPLKCSQRFIPSVNQSITIKVVSLTRLPLGSNCQTACGDGGCRCLPEENSLSSVNHLVLTTNSGKMLSCLCGDFQQEWLPVGLRSWSPITLVYYVAQYSWTMKGFSFQADYTFHSDNTCGHHVINQHSGAIYSGHLEGGNQLNYYFHQSCTWLLDSNVERQLTVDIESTQNRPCTAWNLTIHEYNEISPERTGPLLHTFCPRYVQQTYALPWKLNIILIRLNAMTRMPPEFIIKWKSQIVRTNTRLAGVTPQPSKAAIWKNAIFTFLITPIIICTK